MIWPNTSPYKNICHFATNKGYDPITIKYFQVPCILIGKNELLVYCLIEIILAQLNMVELYHTQAQTHTDSDTDTEFSVLA